VAVEQVSLIIALRAIIVNHIMNYLFTM
jgi:hypothetical protein